MSVSVITLPPGAITGNGEPIWVWPKKNSRSISWFSDIGEFSIIIGGEVSQVHFTKLDGRSELIGTFAYNDNLNRAKRCVEDRYQFLREDNARKSLEAKPWPTSPRK